MYSLKPIGMLTVCVFMLTGCMAAKSVDPRITILGTFLATDIAITDVSSLTNKGGFLLDQNGFVIPTILSRWTSFPAYEKSEFRFKAVAPKTTATNFRILIRKES
jgi:hypothetical protein